MPKQEDGATMDKLGAHSEIAQASRRIAPYVKRTPCLPGPRGTLLKREDLQVSGSFKIRGVANVLLGRAASSPAPAGAVCVSTGNTGRALAQLGLRLGLPVHVFIENGLDPGTSRQLTASGATVIRGGSTFSAAAKAAKDFAISNNLVYCSPGSDWSFAFGVASVGVEIHDQTEGLRELFVPVGGGGLAAGLAAFYATMPPADRPTLIGVQAERSSPVAQLYRREKVREPEATIATCLSGDLEDGAIIKDVVPIVFGEFVTLSESELRAAHRELVDMGVYASPGGCAGYGAFRKLGGSAEHSCIVITGADFDGPALEDGLLQ